MFRMSAALWVLLVAITSVARAQSTSTDFRDEAIEHFERSSSKIIQLAAAMPEELYGWSPMENVMHVSQVYMHIARYNYLYLSRELGLPLPAHIDMSTMEAVTEKARVTAMLQESVEYVRRHIAAMNNEDLTRVTRLYGREVPGWAVLFQLVAHMNEHVGQSVAYARMNSIVPPWSMP